MFTASPVAQIAADLTEEKTVKGMPHDLSVALLEMWTAAFEAESRGRVFHQSEDRIRFRGAVARRTASVRVTFLRALAAQLGQPLPGNSSRHLASRAIADAWMGGARLLGDPVGTRRS